MKYNKMYILVVLLILSISISAQSVISGKVIDKDNAPVAGATIVVVTHADSTYITGVISDLDGQFEIPNLKPDSYILSFSMMGLKRSACSNKSDQILKTNWVTSLWKKILICCLL